MTGEKNMKEKMVNAIIKKTKEINCKLFLYFRKKFFIRNNYTTLMQIFQKFKWARSLEIINC